ncbi:uncharacterized protein LOC100305471 [Glycine max]|nr:uncharacterized protein LOC100305471 [Glycine max]ACU13147.1 unknown [Glycine max]|eukprot:NP_001235861.1 uncharacterized protein LOC100305471 [Glycine max]
MEKFECEMGGVLYAHGQKNLCGSEKHQAKKKVRFAKEALGNNNCRKGDRMVKIRVQRIKAEEILVIKNVQKWRHGPKLEDMMPPNRAVLYRGIMKHRNRSIYGRLRF